MSKFSDVVSTGLGSLVGGFPGAALGLGTSVISSLWSNSMNKSNVRMVQDWQEKMNLQQQDWQEGMWNKTNEYNSPVNQMQRLKDAGINPTSAAGLVGGNANSAQLAAQPQIPSGNPVPGVDLDLVNGINSAMAQQKEMQLMDAQKKNIEADTAGKLQNVDTSKAQEEHYRQLAENVRLDNLYKPDRINAEINNIKAGTDELIAKANLSASEKKQLDYIIDEILPLQKQLTGQQIQEAISRVSANMAQASAAYASAKASSAQADLLESQKAGQDWQNQLNKTFAPLERLNGIRNNYEAIRNLKLTNDEKKYFVDQFKAYGMNVSDADIPALVKLGMLANLGYGDASSAIGLQKNMSEQSFLNGVTGLVGKAFSILQVVLGAKVAGKAVGSSLSSGTQNLQVPYSGSGSFNSGSYFSSNTPYTYSP